MIVSSRDKTCYLLELTDIARGDVPNAFQMHLNSIKLIVDWAKEYVCQPHPQLGRPGSVCSFVPVSMKKGLFFLSVYPAEGLEENTAYDFLLKYRDFFLELKPVIGDDAVFKTFLILFPYLPKEPSPKFIAHLQQRLKMEFVKHGWMIGEFHSGSPQKTGLWNENFYPLYSPIPLLVIRYLVPNDFYSLSDQKEFVTLYLQKCRDKIPEKLVNLVKEACIKFDINYPI